MQTLEQRKEERIQLAQLKLEQMQHQQQESREIFERISGLDAVLRDQNATYHSLAEQQRVEAGIAHLKRMKEERIQQLVMNERKREQELTTLALKKQAAVVELHAQDDFRQFKQEKMRAEMDAALPDVHWDSGQGFTFCDHFFQTHVFLAWSNGQSYLHNATTTHAIVHLPHPTPSPRHEITTRFSLVAQSLRMYTISSARSDGFQTRLTL